jgi:hypothetical protein
VLVRVAYPAAMDAESAWSGGDSLGGVVGCDQLGVPRVSQREAVLRGALFKYVAAVGGGLLGAFEPGLSGIARGLRRVEDQSAPCLPARLRVELPELSLQVSELPVRGQLLAPTARSSASTSASGRPVV